MVELYDLRVALRDNKIKGDFAACICELASDPSCAEIVAQKVEDCLITGSMVIFQRILEVTRDYPHTQTRLPEIINRKAHTMLFHGQQANFLKLMDILKSYPDLEEAVELDRDYVRIPRSGNVFGQDRVRITSGYPIILEFDCDTGDMAAHSGCMTEYSFGDVRKRWVGRPDREFSRLPMLVSTIADVAQGVICADFCVSTCDVGNLFTNAERVLDNFGITDPYIEDCRAMYTMPTATRAIQPLPSKSWH